MSGGLLALLMALLLGCGEPEPACDTGPVVSWEGWGQDFFRTYCDSCHAASTPERFGAPDEATFDSAEQVAEQVVAIRERVLEQGNMPPSGGVPDEELVLLEFLLDCGLE